MTKIHLVSIAAEPDCHFILLNDVPAGLLEGRSLYLKRISDGQWLTSEGWRPFAKPLPFRAISRNLNSSMIGLEKGLASGIRFGDGVEFHFDSGLAPFRLRWTKPIDIDAHGGSSDLSSVEDPSILNHSNQSDIEDDLDIEPVISTGDPIADDGLCSGTPVISYMDETLNPDPADIETNPFLVALTITSEIYEMRLRELEMLAKEFEAGEISALELLERKTAIRRKII